MASLRMRSRKDGSVYASVLFREHGRQSSVSFDDVKVAKKFQKLVDQCGPEKAKELVSSFEIQEKDSLLEFCSSYIDSLKTVQTATVAQYRSYLARDIAPVLGHLPLLAITRQDIGMWLNSLAGSPKTIANKHGFLSSVFKEAIRQQLIALNPCDARRLPKIVKSEMVFLTPEEFSLIVNNMDEYWRPLAYWLAFTGMRISEATALLIGDIDVEHLTCRINKAWKRSKASDRELGTPKTRKSIRTINIPSHLLVQLNMNRSVHCYVFESRNGGAVGQKEFYQHGWKPALEKLALYKKPRVHDLRHSCASWMIQAGVPLPVVQAHLGHESIQTTVDVYGHLDRRAAASGAEALDKLFVNL